MQMQPIQHASNSTPRILTAAEAASVLRVHPATITRMIQRGQLRAARAGDAIRIKAEDLEALFK
jgi:excisionase family DNA binding protein